MENWVEFIELLDIFEQLDQPGLNEEVLSRVVVEGYRELCTTTANDPLPCGGSVAYFRKVRALRDILVGHHKWSRLVDTGVELVVSPDGSIAICVWPGDAATGNLLCAPSLRNPRGPATRYLIEANQAHIRRAVQPDMFAPPALRLVGTQQIWALVFHHNEAEELSTAEFSLPLSLSSDGIRVEWGFRGCLQPIQHNDADIEPHDSIDADDVIDIDITPR